MDVTFLYREPMCTTLTEHFVCVSFSTDIHYTRLSTLCRSYTFKHFYLK